MPLRVSSPAAVAARAGTLVATVLLACMLMLPVAAADSLDPPASDVTTGVSRLSNADPLNGGLVIVNMHGMLFHPDVSDIQEDVNYARWLGSGVIRVFATDSQGRLEWDGQRIGTRIADIAPMLRAAHVRLIVSLVNNHRAVPAEPATSSGWMDNYWQLLLPFYTTTWQDAYQSFVTGLISTVGTRDALDVMYAWELGNELHTPVEPAALMPFISDAAALVRSLDPLTPILPGTMGANHVEPGNPESPIARWLYCDAPIDAYTLHAYDWVSPQRPGDMPINWDLDTITARPCPNGRTLPVIVEELGTSRALQGVYVGDDEAGRLQQELHQIDYVRSYPQVLGFGIWNGESPRLVDRTFFDTRRGLTSYGSNAAGGGSCYDPAPDPVPGVRCQVEQTLRGLRSVRLEGAGEWTTASNLDTTNPLVAQVDRLIDNRTESSVAISGRILDPSADPDAGGDNGPPVQSVEVRMAGSDAGVAPLASAALQTSEFRLSVPLAQLPGGTSTLVLDAYSPQWGNWLTTLRVEVPVLGPDPVARPVAPVFAAAVQPPPPRRAAVIESPQPGDSVPRRFVLQLLAPRADRVDVFLDPGRDRGGRLVGSAAAESTASGEYRVTVTVPSGSQTLELHASSTLTGKDELLTLPIVVS
jgi:hypothetical protein